jgi:2-dehydro-3-deoxy-D-arabinonate dehydratase
MASHHCELCSPAIPLCPVEVWGCRSSVAAPVSEGGERGLADALRPDLFFKGTARICVGPDQPIGIRPDSQLTVPEPALAVVLGAKGQILGYTLANDVSARDMQQLDWRYLSQAKIYKGSCALGPVIVTPEELPELGKLEMSCAIVRGGEQRFSGSASLASIENRIEALVHYLLRSNPVPAGTVLLTGVGIPVADEAALAPGDTVTIRVPGIGQLSNPAALVI